MRAANGQFLKGAHWRHESPHWDANWLRNEYQTKQRSTGEIAEEIGITDAAILYWLKKHGIQRRSVSQARAIKHWGAVGEANPMHGKTGDKNPRYIDGSSPDRQRLYAQGEGREFLRSILERDGYRCAHCGAEKGARKSLHVHHIKPWAGNSDARFDPANAITLCRGCHSWVHSKENKNKDYLK